MRALLMVLLAANLGVTAAGWVLLPDRVAVHFASDGRPDGWGSQRQQAAVMTVVHVLIFALLWSGPALVVRLPPRWVNLPHREYWLRPERKAQTRKLLERLLGRFGSVLLLLHVILGVLVLRANLRRPPWLEVRLLYIALAAFALYTVGWLVTFWRAFRIPASADA